MIFLIFIKLVSIRSEYLQGPTSKEEVCEPGHETLKDGLAY